MKHRTDIQVRFADTDALGHLNNTAYALYAEQARVDFFRHLALKPKSLILANINLDFLAQVHFGTEVFVLTNVASLGNSSMHLVQSIHSKDPGVEHPTLVANVSSVVVHFNYQTQNPERVPDTLRQQLAPFLG